MKVVICHNCGGFGWTQGPVLLSTGGREIAVYKCGACEGKGYLHV